MLKRYSFLCWLFFAALPLQAQITVSGRVVDAQDGQPLPFANVFLSSQKGTVTNENGQFRIQSYETADELIISYLGYEPYRLPVRRDTTLTVELRQTAFKLNEVVVRAPNDKQLWKWLKKSIRASRRLTDKRMDSKAFRRTYTVRGEQEPTELLEAFYNVQTSRGGVDAFVLKNGRIGLPPDSYLLSFDLTQVLENYGLFQPYVDFLPRSPYSYLRLNQLEEDYELQFVSEYPEGEDRILRLRFEAKDKRERFSGEVYIRRSNWMAERLRLTIQDAREIPFHTVANPERNQITGLDVEMEMSFRYQEEEIVADHLFLLLQYQIQRRREIEQVISKTNLIFYDYGDPFPLPLSGEIDPLNDYEKILSLPYRAEFWKRNYLLQETDEEANFRENLEARNPMDNKKGWSPISLLKKRFEPWQADWKIDRRALLVGSRLTGDPDEEQASANIRLKAAAFLFLDYECYPDKAIFRAEPVWDYRKAFVTKRDSISMAFLHTVMELAKQRAQGVERELAREFPDPCDEKEKVFAAMRRAQRAFEQEIYQYNRLINDDFSWKSIQHLERKLESGE